MKVRIYSPTKSAMQSGKKNAKKWLIKPIEEEKIRSFDPLMGWVSAQDTSSQIGFEFSSKEEAIEFAKKKNFEFVVEEPKKSTIKPKSYAENFTS